MHIAPIDIAEIVGIGASLVGVFLAKQKATKRDDEQERAIGELQKALGSSQGFKPSKWYRV